MKVTKIVIEANSEQEVLDIKKFYKDNNNIVIKRMFKKSSYYSRNKEKVLKKAKEKYESTHERKNARYYEVISPEGKITKYKSLRDLCDFFGYSRETIFKRQKNNDLFGYTVRRVVYN